MADLGVIAKSLAAVDEGVACVGTALESRTFRVKGKAFLFVSQREARLKLATSLAEAARLGCSAGANGWVKIALDAQPHASVLKRWIAESHALLGGGASRPKAAREPASKARTLQAKAVKPRAAKPGRAIATQARSTKKPARPR